MATYLVEIDFERLTDRLASDREQDAPIVDVAGWLKDEGFSAVRGGWICADFPAKVLKRPEYRLLDCYS